MSNYSAKELQAIIKLATELDKQKNSKEFTETFSLSEIQEIANSSGISDQSLEEALKIVQQKGLSPKVVEERVSVQEFISAKIDEDAWEILIQELRAQFKQPGSSSELKNKYEWSAVMRKNGYVHVSVTKNEAISEIQISADLSRLETRLKLSSTALGFAVFAVLSSLLNLDVYTNFLPLAVNLLGGGVGYILSSFAIKAVRKRRAETYHALIRKLRDRLSKSSQKETPAIQIDDLGQPLANHTIAIKQKER